jgi:geranylgeranyl diphosphate synthase, type I
MTSHHDDSLATSDAFRSYAKKVRAALETELSAWLGERQAAAERLHPDVGAIVGAMSDLATRGGKRFRAVLVAAAYEACGGPGGPAPVLWAGISMEILQTYLLIHDDWMDGDETRRGGPSVHASLRARFGSAAAGDATAILAGDYGAALALEALMRVEVDPARLALATREMARMQCDVVLGQMLDVRGAASNPKDVEAMHALKTASYTARGPLLLGAALAGATADQRAALEAAAAPLGVAFQLRDDLLGAFGDPARTGKPKGGDLRQGKRNSLLLELTKDPEAFGRVETVLGKPEATDAAIDLALEAMVRSGAKERVEKRLGALLLDARSILARAPLVDPGRGLLIGAVDALGMRED